VAFYLHPVIPGLDPAIPIIWHGGCFDKRDGRVKPGHDNVFLYNYRTNKPRNIIQYSIPRLLIQLWKIWAVGLSMAPVQISIPS
jgi:hypothetical protein